MPRRYDGPAASAHSAAMTGVSSPTSWRSASSPSSRSVAGHGQPVVVERDAAAHPGQQVAQGVTGLGGVPRPVAHGHLAPGRGGERQERARRWTGRARWCGRPPGSRRGRPATGAARCRRPRRRARAASPRSCRDGAATAPACRRAARRRPRRSGRRPAAARRRTGWTPTRRGSTCPPRTDPVPWTVNGSRSPSIRTPSAPRASSTSPTGRVRMWGSPSKATGPSASPATGGTNRVTVPARPQSTATPPVSATGRHPPVGAGRVDGGAQRGQGAGHQQGVARGQRTTDHARAVGQRAPAPGPGWSATCSRAARRPPRPDHRRTARATGDRRSAGRAARHGGAVRRRSAHRRSVPSAPGSVVSSGGPWRPEPRRGPGGPAPWPRGGRPWPRAGHARRRPDAPRCRRRRSAGRRPARRP